MSFKFIFIGQYYINIKKLMDIIKYRAVNENIVKYYKYKYKKHRSLVMTILELNID